MAIDLNKQRAYRLVYFQPDPEDGERVCVGLLFRDHREYSLVYDSSFPKLSCIAPRYEKSVLKLYLDELKESLSSATAEDEAIILRQYVPQIIVSDERDLLAPLTESIKQRLLERFVLGEPGLVKRMVAEELRAPKWEYEVEERIAGFLKELLPAKHLDVLYHAKPKQVIGRTLPNVGPVAASVHFPGKIILVDGVDLKMGTPKRVISRVNKVTHTFWEYGREYNRTDTGSFFGTETLQRIALVLNGVPGYSSAQRDAQDFAFHQFEKEADLVVSDEIKQRDILRNLLAGR
jgi:hypothetical protein